MRCNKYFTLILLQFVIYVCVWTSWAHIYEYFVLLCKIGCDREQGPRRFSRKLDSEDGGEHLGQACQKARRRPTCAWGRPKAIHGVARLGAWPLRGAPTRGSLRASRYLGKNTGVIDGSLHISTLLFSFRIYIDYITPLR